MCKSANVTPRKGDILFIRTGLIPEWEAFTTEQKKAYAAQKAPEHAGVEASIELLEWLWDSGIAAVAGDAISWEVSRKSPALFAFGSYHGADIKFLIRSIPRQAQFLFTSIC
jgi:kynurenine formamidase